MESVVILPFDAAVDSASRKVPAPASAFDVTVMVLAIIGVTKNKTIRNKQEIRKNILSVSGMVKQADYISNVECKNKYSFYKIIFN